MYLFTYHAMQMHEFIYIAYLMSIAIFLSKSAQKAMPIQEIILSLFVKYIFQLKSAV